MNTIVWYNPEYKCSVEAKDVKVNLLDNKITIIYSGLESEFKRKFEGRLTFEKKLGVQNCEEKIYYFHSDGNSEIFDISCTGSFTDDAFDEFTGDWYEGDIYNTITISIEDIIDIQGEENSLNLEQAEILLENFNRINSVLPVKDEEITDDSQESLEEITLDLEKAQQLIANFSRLEQPPERKKAFLEIIGISHLESISSKLLGFFFDTEENHGLNDLCIQALYSCLGKKLDEAVRTSSVEREVATEEGSRIDIIIDCYDDLIVIENKLFHDINNPFLTYVSYAESIKEDKKVYYVILGIDKPITLPEQFVFISHFDLADEINKRLGSYLMEADQHYVTLLIDYLHAVENFNPNSSIGKMEQAIVNFFAANFDMIENIFEARIHFIEYAHQKSLAIKNILETKGIHFFSTDDELDTYPGFIGWMLLSKNFESNITPRISYFFGISCYMKQVTLDINFRKNIDGKGTPKDCQNKLKEILNDLNLDFVNDEFSENCEFINIKKFAWNEEPEIIVAKLLPLIEKLQLALGADQ